MDIIIRKALREDCPRLLELVRGLAEFEKAPQEVTVSLSHFEESGFGQNPVWWAFVAEVNGIICGFSLYYIRYSTWKGQRIYLEDLYVDQEYRGKGIGKGLLKKLGEITAERGCGRLEWACLDWNKPSIDFYLSMGAEAMDEWTTYRVAGKTLEDFGKK